MHTFFAPDLMGGNVELPEEEAAHALRVLRLKEGERILAGERERRQGRGSVPHHRQARRQRGGALAREVPRERAQAIHLAVAPTKQIERFEWMLEKCTEIGVDRITPMITARSERTRLRRDRLEKILIAAMKQSKRAWLPRLDEAIDLQDLLQAPLPAQRIFGWCEGEREPLTKAYDRSQEALLLIGPEGDFTPEEAMQLKHRSFRPISLGEARLRTETAAVAACPWMNFRAVDRLTSPR
jgi:16S rRNA (uracil1498-N3)-methyltransferase